MKNLILLDLDEMLIYSCSEYISRQADFMVGYQMIFVRPGTNEFLSRLSMCYSLGIWSAASEKFCKRVVGKLFFQIVQPEFVWSRNNCTLKTNENSLNYFVRKTSKLEFLGWALE